MTRRTLTAITLITLALPGLAHAAEGSPLDISSVDRIVVTGDASRIWLTTSTHDAFEATLETRQTGWFARWQSSWFVNDCTSGGAMRIEGRTLFIDTPSSSGLGLSDCKVDVRANLPPGGSIAIDQKALMANLSGRYASVNVRSKAGDIVLDGGATAIDIEGEAMRTRLEFDGESPVETIRMAGKAMDATLKFVPGTAVKYRVDATASFIDSTLENKPQAKSSVLITGEFVRATIR